MSCTTQLLTPSPALQAVHTKATQSRTRGFGWVMLAVLALFCGLEGVTRCVLIPASKDFSRFVTYPEHAADLVAQSGTRIALVGNSTTHRGVDLECLQLELARSGVNGPHCDMFVADSSKIDTWYYIFNQYFWRAERKPDLYVVTYYENNLIDGNRIEIGRLAQFFTEPADWPEIFRNDLTHPGDRAEFVLSSFWATLAARERIQQRVLRCLSPNVEEYIQNVNSVAYRRVHSTTDSQEALQPQPTHSMLRRLIDRTQVQGARLCFVAFPTLPCRSGAKYPLRQETLDVIRRTGMDFIDLRHMPELTPDMYADDLHLTEPGQKVYSRRLAAALMKQSSVVSGQVSVKNETHMSTGILHDR